MTFALTATTTNHEAQLNFEQIAGVLSLLQVGNGAPVGIVPAEGFYFRLDGGAGTTIYQVQAGAWVGVV